MHEETLLSHSQDGEDGVILSAFCDGETVDPDALALALARPSGRALLVDFARLRRSAREVDGPLPVSLVSLKRRSTLATISLPLPAVAALVLVVALAVLFVSRTWNVNSLDAPPTPSRAVTFEPGVDWHSTF